MRGNDRRVLFDMVKISRGAARVVGCLLRLWGGGAWTRTTYIHWRGSNHYHYLHRGR